MWRSANRLDLLAEAHDANDGESPEVLDPKRTTNIPESLRALL